MTINITGTIGCDISSSDVLAALAECTGSVDIYLDSPGGDVVESNAMSLAIAQFAMGHPEMTYTATVGGLCASAAANLLVKLPKAFTIKAYSGSLIMYHSVTTMIDGNPQQLRDVSVMMDLVNEGVVRALSARTTLDLATIKAAFTGGRELWLDGNEAKDCGLVDELIDAEPVMVEFTANAKNSRILKLVAEYKSQHKTEAKMDENEVKAPEAKAEETPEVKAEETTETKEEIKEEVEKELETPAPEVDWEAECGKLKAECDELKKEIEGLKALVAKYKPSAKPTDAKQAVKADWLSLVRALNAKHLPEAEYDREYVKLKAEHQTEFQAFMKERTVR